MDLKCGGCSHILISIFVFLDSFDSVLLKSYLKYFLASPKFFIYILFIHGKFCEQMIIFFSIHTFFVFLVCWRSNQLSCQRQVSGEFCRQHLLGRWHLYSKVPGRRWQTRTNWKIESFVWRLYGSVSLVMEFHRGGWWLG